MTSPRTSPLGHDEKAYISFKCQRAREEVKTFLATIGYTPLRAWLWHYDPDNDKNVSRKIFINIMQGWNFPGDAELFFDTIDLDGNGQIRLSELEPEQSEAWKTFCQWCTRTFKNIQDFRWTLQGLSKWDEDKRAPLSFKVFSEGLVSAGWTGGHIALLFDALDSDKSGTLQIEDLVFLDTEFKRHHKKSFAKQQAQRNAPLEKREKKASRLDIDSFKLFLRKQYGNYIRAWRVGLCPGGGSSIRQAQFLKACADMGWGGSKQLWRAFDDDQDGWFVLDQLDLKSAELLARFRDFVVRKFGSASAAFRALDRRGTQKLKQDEFCEALKATGFHLGTKRLFHGLDKGGDKSIDEEDMLFVDAWQPLPYLIVFSDFEALDELKLVLVKTYKNLLTAWRRDLDADGSNHCTWTEFTAVCKKVSFKGNVPGSWRALDEDLSGFITFAELDRGMSGSIEAFKQWADAEFGSVGSLFGVFNEDGSKELTHKEFQNSCRIYGFDGDVAFFKALDHDNKGVSLRQMSWLDNWNFKSTVIGSGITPARVPIKAEIVHSDETVQDFYHQQSCPCGNILLEDSVFCRKCGRKRSEERAGNEKAVIDSAKFSNAELVSSESRSRHHRDRSNKQVATKDGNHLPTPRRRAGGDGTNDISKVTPLPPLAQGGGSGDEHNVKGSQDHSFGNEMPPDGNGAIHTSDHCSDKVRLMPGLDDLLLSYRPSYRQFGKRKAKKALRAKGGGYSQSRNLPSPSEDYIYLPDLVPANRMK